MRVGGREGIGTKVGSPSSSSNNAQGMAADR